VAKRFRVVERRAQRVERRERRGTDHRVTSIAAGALRTMRDALRYFG
jgi:hypothetical protein